MSEENKVSERLFSQYNDIAAAIEVEGLGYAVLHGYIAPNTDDEELNDAIKKAEHGLYEIQRIMEPYSY